MGGRVSGSGVRPAGLHPHLHGPADHRRHCQQEGVQVSPPDGKSHTIILTGARMVSGVTQNYRGDLWLVVRLCLLIQCLFIWKGLPLRLCHTVWVSYVFTCRLHI